MEGCLSWKGQGTGRVWGLLLLRRRKVWQRGARLISDSIPWPSAMLEGRRLSKLGVKVSLETRKGWGEYVLRFFFFSHCPTLIWLAINQTNFPKSNSFAHDRNQFVIPPCPYPNPWIFSYIFFPLSRWGGEWKSGFSVKVSWPPGMVNLQQSCCFGNVKHLIPAYTQFLTPLFPYLKLELWREEYESILWNCFVLC